MGWETRKKGTYYYAKRRVDGRVTSSYYGRTATACAIADFQEQETELRRLGMATEREDRAQLAAFDRVCTDLAQQCQELASAILLAGGYHQHKGQWRKRRMPKKAVLATVPPRPESGDTSREALHVLMQRCNRQDADSADIAALRELVGTAHPHVAKLGDMLDFALSSVTTGEGMYNATGLTIAATEAHSVQRKKALGYATASPLEKPLIAHLVLCEQRLGIVEILYGRVMAKEMTLKQADYWERRLTQVQQRYLKAVETLAKIRRVRVEAWQSDSTHAAGVAVERAG